MFPATSALCATCWPASAASIWCCWSSRPTNPSSRRPASTSTSAACSPVQRGITVLTKSDLVDPETLEVVTMEVADFLKGSFLDPATSPIIAVSSKTGAGLDRLKTELARLAAEVPAKDSTAVFRLPIDRVFTMKGFGTVVTGTLISGTVAQGAGSGSPSHRQAVARARRAGARRSRRTKPSPASAPRLNLAGRGNHRTGARHDADAAADVPPVTSASACSSIFCPRPSRCAIRARASARVHRGDHRASNACSAASSFCPASPDSRA